jgi:hypothetical protein
MENIYVSEKFVSYQTLEIIRHHALLKELLQLIRLQYSVLALNMLQH